MEMKVERRVKIIFVCHGNICRSPMAEYVFRHMLDESGLSSMVEVTSAATSSEEIGNPVYPPARQMLAMHGIGCKGKTAQRITADMFNSCDYVIVMDRYNVQNLERMFKSAGKGKVKLLLEFLPTEHPLYMQDVADPWYTRDFQKAYDDIVVGCKALLACLEKDCLC